MRISYFKRQILLLICLVILSACVPPPSQTANSNNAPPSANSGQSSPMISLPPFNGEKMTVAVIGLRNETEFPDPAFQELRVGFGLSKMFATALFETGRFRLVERNDEVMEKIIKEQWLGQSGYIDPKTAIDTGRMLGAKAIVYGNVTEFGIRKVGVFLGVAGQRNITTRIVIDAKMVSSATGEIIGSASGTGSETTTTAGVFLVWEEGVEQFDQTTVGKASRQAIYQVAEQMAVQYERAIPR